MDPVQPHFLDLARAALRQYGMPGSQLTYLGHSDCVTFRLDESESSSYLLRLHTPRNPALGQHGSDYQSVLSEMLWLEALNRDTSLVLQKPIPNVHGELVSRLERPGGKPLNCTLLRWLNGIHYQREMETEGTARQIGKSLAILHTHASAWQPPAGFTRPRRDGPYFRSVLENLRSAISPGLVSAEDFRTIELAVEKITLEITSQPEDRATHGLIHADAHKGNLLYDRGELRLIDFSFCSFGSYCFDLAIALADMQEHLRASCLQSYESLRPLPHGYQRDIEAFFIGSMVGTYTFWLPEQRHHELLVTHVPRFVRQYVDRYLRDARFWFCG